MNWLFIAIAIFGFYYAATQFKLMLAYLGIIPSSIAGVSLDMARVAAVSAIRWIAWSIILLTVKWPMSITWIILALFIAQLLQLAMSLVLPEADRKRAVVNRLILASIVGIAFVVCLYKINDRPPPPINAQVQQELSDMAESVALTLDAYTRDDPAEHAEAVVSKTVLTKKIQDYDKASMDVLCSTVDDIEYVMWLLQYDDMKQYLSLRQRDSSAVFKESARTLAAAKHLSKRMCEYLTGNPTPETPEQHEALGDIARDNNLRSAAENNIKQRWRIRADVYQEILGRKMPDMALYQPSWAKGTEAAKGSPVSAVPATP